MRLIDAAQLDDIALGAAVLGTGGGGDPYIGKLMAQQAIERNGPVQLITVDELDDDCADRLLGGNGRTDRHDRENCVRRRDRDRLQGAAGLSWETDLRDHVGRGWWRAIRKRPFRWPLNWVSRCVDGDLMGRAFPEIQMVTPTLYGISATPMAIADEKGNSAILNTDRQSLDRDPRSQHDDRDGMLVHRLRCSL